MLEIASDDVGVCARARQTGPMSLAQAGSTVRRLPLSDYRKLLSTRAISSRYMAAVSVRTFPSARYCRSVSMRLRSSAARSSSFMAATASAGSGARALIWISGSPVRGSFRCACTYNLRSSILARIVYDSPRPGCNGCRLARGSRRPANERGCDR